MRRGSKRRSRRGGEKDEQGADARGPEGAEVPRGGSPWSGNTTPCHSRCGGRGGVYCFWCFRVYEGLLTPKQCRKCLHIRIQGHRARSRCKAYNYIPLEICRCLGRRHRRACATHRAQYVNLPRCAALRRRRAAGPRRSTLQGCNIGRVANSTGTAGPRRRAPRANGCVCEHHTAGMDEESGAAPEAPPDRDGGSYPKGMNSS